MCIVIANYANKTNYWYECNRKSQSIVIWKSNDQTEIKLKLP